MSGLPIAIVVAIPLIAAFVVFVLFPRIYKSDDEEHRR